MSFKFNPFTGTLDIVNSSSGGSGDVNGPSSAGDSNLAVFDGTTGKLIKDSVFSTIFGNALTPVTDQAYNLGHSGNFIFDVDSSEWIPDPEDPPFRFNQLALAAGLQIGENSAGAFNLFWDGANVNLYSDSFIFKNSAGDSAANLRLTVTDRAIINIDEIIFELASDDGSSFAVGTNAITLTNKDFEIDNNTLGNIYWSQNSQSDIGAPASGTGPGRRCPRDLYIGRSLYFGLDGSYDSVITADTSGQDLFWNIQVLRMRNAGGGANFWTWDFNGANRIDTNLSILLETDGTRKITICDSDGNGNTKRLQNVTLVAGTKIVSNDSVTAKTVFLVTNNGLSGAATPPSYSVARNAGVGYTITSSDVADTSTVSVFLIENGL